MARAVKSIWFVDVHLSEVVHAGPLGFTKLVHKYVSASSPGDAERAATRWATSKGAKVTQTSATLALQQDLRRYVFPEQILAA